MKPPKAPTANLFDLDTKELLTRLKAVREEAGRLEVQLRRQSVHRAALEVFRAEIDEVARLITGDAGYFHGRAHSFSYATKSSEP